METIKPTLTELETLVAVVHCGSITAAAERLNTTKSVISKRIAQLENTLDCQLFTRTGRKMQPTDSGLRVYEHAGRVIRGVEQLVDDVVTQSGKLQGTIRISGPQSFGTRYLSPLVVEFMLAHPGVTVVLDLDDKYRDLRAGEYDFAVRIGRLKDSSLKARKLAASPRGIFCSPGYLQTISPPRTPDELLPLRLLGYANARSGHIWKFRSDSGQETRQLNITPCLLSDSGEVLRDAAIKGLGITALPFFLAGDALHRRELEEIMFTGWTMAEDTVYAVYPETIALPARVRAMIDYLAGRIASVLTDSRGN